MSRKRIHIPIGGALRAFAGLIEYATVAVIIALLWTLAIMCPGEAEAQTFAKKLPIAQTHDRHWRTYAFVSNDTGATVHVDFATCLTNAAAADVKDGGSFRLDDVGDYQCALAVDAKEFYTIDAPPGAHALLAFDDGKTANSYDIRPLGAFPVGGWFRVSPLSNDKVFTSTLDAFATVETRFFVYVFDGLNRHLGFDGKPDGKTRETMEPEICDAEPPVTQCAIKTPFSVGSIEITSTVFRGPQEPTYFFIARTSKAGGNATIFTP